MRRHIERSSSSRVGAEGREHLFGRARCHARTLDHFSERGGQVHGGRPSRRQSLGVGAKARVERLTSVTRERGERGDETHRTGNANGRGAADGESGDGVTHFVERPQVALDELFRQLCLVDDADCVALRRPSHRLDKAHGGGT
jgi:hypothetical protein